MDKKGQDTTLGMNVPYVIIVGIVLVLIFITLFGYYTQYWKTVVGPTDLTEIVIYNDLLLGNCFAYRDAVTGRTYPFEIDLNTFTDARLKSCFSPNDRSDTTRPSWFQGKASTKKGPVYSVRLTLQDAEGKEVKQIDSLESHQGTPRAISTTVLVREKEKIYPATIQTQVWFNYG